MFAYDDAVVRAFPTIRAGVIHATGLTNGPSPAALLEEYRAAQRAASDRLATTAIAEIASIRAWRRVLTGFGVKPTQHRVAAEALLRRLDKKGDIPSIGTLVDIGNLVSIRCALPVAVFDLAGIDGAIAVRFATGQERFTDLGSTEPVAPEPGEVVFVDRAGVVAARRWCWRQSAQSATGPATAEALVVVEGHHEAAGADSESAVADLTALLGAYQSGCSTTTRLLTADGPHAGPARG